MPPAFEHPRAQSGLALMDLVVSIVIVVLLTMLLMLAISRVKTKTREKSAKVRLQILQVAAERYVMDFNDFPPVDAATLSSTRLASALLHSTLSRYLSLQPDDISPRANGEKPALISTFGGHYATGFEGKGDRRVQWVIVDPGRDKLLGGTMDAENGFVPDNSDANGDGKPDHLDNLIEKVSLR